MDGKLPVVEKATRTQRQVPSSITSCPVGSMNLINTNHPKKMLLVYNKIIVLYATVCDEINVYYFDMITVRRVCSLHILSTPIKFIFFVCFRNRIYDCTSHVKRFRTERSRRSYTSTSTSTSTIRIGHKPLLYSTSVECLSFFNRF